VASKQIGNCLLLYLKKEHKITSFVEVFDCIKYCIQFKTSSDVYKCV